VQFRGRLYGMTKSGYYQVIDGEWVPTIGRGIANNVAIVAWYTRLITRIMPKQIEFQVFRDARATAAARRRLNSTKDND